MLQMEIEWMGMRSTESLKAVEQDGKLVKSMAFSMALKWARQLAH